jgi:regulation of enolase protein 1 (concanavalin A-like superfamily)
MTSKKPPRINNPGRLPKEIWAAIIGLGVPIIAGLMAIIVTLINNARSPVSPLVPPSSSTPFSGRILFTSPTGRVALSKYLNWEAGSSETSAFTLSSDAIYLTAGAHTWPNFPTINYSQPVEGDFDVQVKLNFKSPVQKLTTAQMAGLVIRPMDAHLFVGNSSFPTDWVVAAKYISDAGIQAGCRGSWATYDLDSVYLRLERANNIWQCAYSENGENWKWLNGGNLDSQELRYQQLEIGLFAYSDTADAITVEFSNWILTKK